MPAPFAMMCWKFHSHFHCTVNCTVCQAQSYSCVALTGRYFSAACFLNAVSNPGLNSDIQRKQRVLTWTLRRLPNLFADVGLRDIYIFLGVFMSDFLWESLTTLRLAQMNVKG